MSTKRESFAELRVRAEGGDPGAMVILAEALFAGDGIEQDEQACITWLTRAAALNFVPAMNDLGIIHGNAHTIGNNAAIAEGWFRKASDLGHTEAENNLGVMFHERGDYDKAFLWFGKAAAKNYRDAQNNLAVCFMHGHGVAKDERKAEELFRAAAKQGHSEAQVEVGLRLKERGEHEEAAAWFRRAADENDTEACYEIGLAYFSGRGVPRSHSEAVNWWKRAVHFYSPEKKRKAYRGSDRKTFDLVLIGLGHAVKHGLGCERDDAAALVCFRLAADLGSAEAAYVVGQTWREGDGVEQNNTIALSWFLLGASSGCQRCKQAIEEIENEEAGK